MPALLLPSGVLRSPLMRSRERSDPQRPCGERRGGKGGRGKSWEINWQTDRSRNLLKKYDGERRKRRVRAENGRKRKALFWCQ